MQMIYLPTAVKKSFDACGGNSCYEVARAISHARTAVQADKLKKAPPGSVRTFASEISTAQAAIAFVDSLDPETRAKLHWRVPASALNGLAAGQGSFDRQAGSNAPTMVTSSTPSGGPIIGL